MEVEEDGIGSAALADVKEESSVEEAAGESEGACVRASGQAVRYCCLCPD